MNGDKIAAAFKKLNPQTLIQNLPNIPSPNRPQQGQPRGASSSSTLRGSSTSAGGARRGRVAEEDQQPHFNPTQSEVSDEELLSSVPKEFYEENVDEVQYILENLPKDFTTATLDREINDKMRAMDLIDSKLTSVILDNYKSFVAGMSRVQEFEADLIATISLQRKSRIHLTNAKNGLTGGGMQIVEKARKRKLLTKIYDDTEGVKQILVNAKQMDVALAEADYPLAIEMCMRCQQDVEKYSMFQSVKEVGERFGTSFEQIEDKLQASLGSICRQFNPVVYEKSLIGFKLVAKHHEVIEIIQKHMSEELNVLTHQIVLNFAMSSIAGDVKAKPERLKSKPFKELCAMLRDDIEFIPCLRILMEKSCNHMLNFYAMIKWHGDAVTAGESNKYFAEVEQNLLRSRKLIWEDVQRRLGACLNAKSLAGFKIDDFLTLLNLINKFINIGDTFTSQQSPILRSIVKQQAELYFSVLHKQDMEKIKTMLENESWLPCPLQPDFSIKTLREFDFSRNVALPASLAEANVDVVHGNLELFNSTLALGGFSFENEEMPTISKGKVLTSASSSAGKNGVTKSLSARSVNQATNDDDSSDDEGPEELKRDFVEDGDTPKKAGSAGGAAGSKGWEDESVNATVRARRNAAARGSEAVSVVGGGPILASTTVYVVRTIGHYMSMAQVLSPIAYEVLVAMTHVVEYYLYCVFKFFATDVRSANELVGGIDPTLAARLRSTLKRLRDRYDAAEPNSAQAAAANKQQQEQLSLLPAESMLNHKFTIPKLSTQVQLNVPDGLFGLNNRVTANESIVYLENVLRTLRGKLEALMPANNAAFLSQFFSQTVDTVNDLRLYIYRCISRRLINVDRVIDQINKVDWKMKDSSEKHSQYVQDLALEFLQFKTRLDTDTTSKLKDVPSSVVEILWKQLITHSIDTLVDAYCTRKEFSDGGRAQMQLDFASLQEQLVSLTKIKPIPHRAFMDLYIKSYYVPENEFDKWFNEHKSEFTTKQLRGVVSTNRFLVKNSNLRKQYIKAIEDIESGGKRILNL